MATSDPASGPAVRSRDRVVVRTTMRLAAVSAVTAAAYYVVFEVVAKPPLHDFFDLRVYRGAVLWWLQGEPLYAFALPPGLKGFTYPPFSAALLVPLTWLPEGPAEILVLLASVAVVVLVTWWLVAPVARRHGVSSWFSVALAVPVVLAMEPIRLTLGEGQLNMFILALVLADVVALRRGRAWCGIGIGLATACKLTPGLFIVFLALIGRRRAAVVATGTTLGATLLGFVVAPGTSWQYWTSTLWDTSRVGQLDNPWNQSMLGLLAHVSDPAPPDRLLWALLAAGVAVLGLGRAVRVYRRGDDLAAVTLAGLTACLVSPISWVHHLYWVVPALVVLADVAAGTPVLGTVSSWSRDRPRAPAVGAGLLAVAVAVPFLLSTYWAFVPAAAVPTSVPVDILGRSVYTCAMLALLLLLPARDLTGRTARRPVGEERGPAARSGERSSGRPRPGGWSPR
jgi:alpha-1,2-mannosyltransferase